MDLKKISLVVSIFGILLLLVLLNVSKPKLININQINQDMMNKPIRIQGKILDIKEYDSFKLITLEDYTGKINITIHQKYLKFNLIKDSELIIEGVVSSYKKDLQINVNKLILKDNESLSKLFKEY